MFLSSFSVSDALAFLLAATRILAMFLTLPKLVSDRYYFLFRVLFALVLTLVITPLITPSTKLEVEWTPFEITSLLMGEVGVGICLGLAASCAIIGLLAAGQIVSQLLGYQIGTLHQGLSAEDSSDYRKLFFVVGLFAWFAVSGHRFAVEGLIRSFDVFHVGSLHFSTALLDLINQMVMVALQFAIRFSLPVVIVSIFGFLVAGLFYRVLGSGQATSTAFGLNQILFFVISVPLILVFSEETYKQTTGQVEIMIDSLINLQDK